MAYKHFTGASLEQHPAELPDGINLSLQTPTSKASVPHHISQCRCITTHCLEEKRKEKTASSEDANTELLKS